MENGKWRRKGNYVTAWLLNQHCQLVYFLRIATLDCSRNGAKLRHGGQGVWPVVFFTASLLGLRRLELEECGQRLFCLHCAPLQGISMQIGRVNWSSESH
ncbi:MAG TPA: hypothetical protein VMA34_01690 [Terracidiphilus sp.]|nr:hypothetical protein [Terracidiphilus sp.]